LSCVFRITLSLSLSLFSFFFSFTRRACAVLAASGLAYGFSRPSPAPAYPGQNSLPAFWNGQLPFFCMCTALNATSLRIAAYLRFWKDRRQLARQGATAAANSSSGGSNGGGGGSDGGGGESGRGADAGAPSSRSRSRGHGVLGKGRRRRMRWLAAGGEPQANLSSIPEGSERSQSTVNSFTPEEGSSGDHDSGERHSKRTHAQLASQNLADWDNAHEPAAPRPEDERAAEADFRPSSPTIPEGGVVVVVVVEPLAEL
jgi:hypothetical protein